VADRADTAQRPLHRLSVADVTAGELEPLVTGEWGSATGMGKRQQGVQDPHLVTGAQERLDKVGPDEAGAAGDKYSHAPRLGTDHVRATAKRRAITSL